VNGTRPGLQLNSFLETFASLTSLDRLKPIICLFLFLRFQLYTQSRRFYFCRTAKTINSTIRLQNNNNGFNRRNGTFISTKVTLLLLRVSLKEKRTLAIILLYLKFEYHLKLKNISQLPLFDLQHSFDSQSNLKLCRLLKGN